MAASIKVANTSKECVACGCCTKACSTGAVTIYKGLYAKVDTNKCVGCGKCEKICPANVISVVLRGDAS